MRHPAARSPGIGHRLHELHPTPGDLLEDEELAPLALFETIDDGLGGTIQVPRNPLGFRQNSYAVPRLAEHAAELLTETLGVRTEEFAELAATGAFGAPAPTRVGAVAPAV